MTYILTVTLNPCIDRTVTVASFEKGGLNRLLSERDDIGGKAINVSRVLTAIGEENLATGFLFGDTGKKIKRELDLAGIKNDFVFGDHGETRTNIKLMDLSASDTTEINGVGAEVDKALLDAFLEKFTSLLCGASLVVMSGSAPRGVPRDIYKTLGLLARSHGVPVILDADGDLLQSGIEAAPLVIKPNIFELSRLLGKEISENELRDAVMPLLDMGIGIVAVSMGKDGSAFITKDEFLRASAVPVTGGCATAAGDSMVAAMAYGITHGFDLPTLARYASAAGSATAAKNGTEVCTMGEIMDNVGKVEIKQ